MYEKVKNLPGKPGIYKFIDYEGDILYIGKAKNLKKRVSSYFTKNYDNKIRVLVSKISNVEYTIVQNESDALLLENNLIKKHQPRYNVQLKDDKTYPWICIKNEHFPRVFITRNIIKDGSKYYGPYTSAKMVRTILEFIQQIHKIRTCTFNLSEKNIAENKFKACLEYHIGNCNAPCIGLQSKENYDNGIKDIENILRGNLSSVLDHLKSLMDQFASEFRFEEANNMKQKIQLLNKFRSKSTIVNPAIHNVDVFSIKDNEKYAIVNYLRVVNGALLQTHSVEIKKKLDESREELLALAIADIRSKVNSESKELIVPFDISEFFSEYTITIPIRGDKKRLLELADRNAKQMLIDKMIQKDSEQKYFQTRDQRVMETMKKDLQLKSIPDHIDCFDNSNIMGTNPVASCVVFRYGKPSKSEYRHYNIKTVQGPDDYASMEEIVFRRYDRMLREKENLPKLIIIDGGKGQLNAALKSLDNLKLRKIIPIIGIAKRLEEIYFPGDSVPIYLDKNSETLKLIQRIRNEAHRFGITFHRDKRSKTFISSELDKIDGIGESTKKKLYEKYKTIAVIKSKSQEELSEVIGSAKAMIIFKYFRK
ncbi:MAG: excinuclease ABC subunit C [Bacteroidales bacterium]|nr:excinuclease ABC subunit C [Bacteroidales bacterium]